VTNRVVVHACRKSHRFSVLSLSKMACMPYYGDVSLGARIREMTQKRFDERAFGVGGIVGRLSFLS
jgi:hypothetical protein